MGISPDNGQQTRSLCLDGAWKDLVKSNGNAFKNQGQCVKYVVQDGTYARDACTYLNDPALDATYASHGPVTLLFAGGEDVWWMTHDPSAHHYFEVVLLPEGGAPLVLTSFCPTETTGNPWSPCAVWLQPPHDPGVVEAEWATEGSEPADWTVDCG